MNINNFCNNCGNNGHVFYHCKYPITSIGIIVFRKNNDNKKTYKAKTIIRKSSSLNS